MAFPSEKATGRRGRTAGVLVDDVLRHRDLLQIPKIRAQASRCTGPWGRLNQKAMGFRFVIVNSIVYESCRGRAISPSRNPVLALLWAKPCILGFQRCSLVSPSDSMSRRSSAVMAVDGRDLRGNQDFTAPARRVVLHAIDATPARWRTARRDQHGRVITETICELPTHWLLSTHGLLSTASSGSSGSCMSLETHCMVFSVFVRRAHQSSEPSCLKLTFLSF